MTAYYRDHGILSPELLRRQVPRHEITGLPIERLVRAGIKD